MKVNLVKAGAIVIGLGFATTAHAVSFDVSGGSYQIGTGYGCTGPTSTTDLFCATFASTIGNPAAFTLDSVNATKVYNFGTVTFNEDANNIVAGETDNLSVTAILSFLNPFLGDIQSIAVVGAFIGTINDGDIDYSLTFDPVSQSFGNGGSFEVDFSDLSWTGNDATPRTQTVTIKLTALPQEQQLPQDPAPTAIPEPATLALVGIGLAGLGLARRRRAA